MHDFFRKFTIVFYIESIFENVGQYNRSIIWKEDFNDWKNTDIKWPKMAKFKEKTPSKNLYFFVKIYLTFFSLIIIYYINRDLLTFFYDKIWIFNLLYVF